MIFRSEVKKFILFVLFFTGYASAELPKFSIETLPQYDALFCRTTGWTGADAAYSVALGDSVTLWLFSDTWIGPVVDGRHNDATIINNSIALQRGKDPATASVEFLWQTTTEAKPAAFVLAIRRRRRRR
jgi:hypothetical protein